MPCFSALLIALETIKFCSTLRSPETYSVAGEKEDEEILEAEVGFLGGDFFGNLFFLVLGILWLNSSGLMFSGNKRVNQWMQCVMYNSHKFS